MCFPQILVPGGVYNFLPNTQVNVTRDAVVSCPVALCDYVDFVNLMFRAWVRGRGVTYRPLCFQLLSRVCRACFQSHSLGARGCTPLRSNRLGSRCVSFLFPVWRRAEPAHDADWNRVADQR